MTDQYGCSALYLAVYLGNHQCVDILLKHDHIDVNSADNNGLIAAIAHGHLNIVEMLLKHQAIKVNLKDGIGRTAVQYACENGRHDALQLLLQHKDMDIMSNIRQYYLYADNNQKVVEILRKYEHNYENEKPKKKQKK